MCQGCAGSGDVAGTGRQGPAFKEVLAGICFLLHKMQDNEPQVHKLE